MAETDKRRIARIPITCSVVVREKLAIWSSDTEDIGARGCRISLKRPLTPGTVVQLRFERGGGEQPLDAVGQVAWALKSAPLSAGVAFVSMPRDPSGARARNWIDTLVAAHLRRALELGPMASGTVSKMEGVALHLGTPPDASLDRSQVAVIRLAREGVPLSTLCYTPEGLRALVGLLDRGVVSVCRTNPDPEGWKQALSLLADSTQPGRNGAASGIAGAGAVIVPPLPETHWREIAINTIIEEYLRTG